MVRCHFVGVALFLACGACAMKPNIAILSTWHMCWEISRTSQKPWLSITKCICATTWQMEPTYEAPLRILQVIVF